MAHYRLPINGVPNRMRSATVAGVANNDIEAYIALVLPNVRSNYITAFANAATATSNPYAVINLIATALAGWTGQEGYATVNVDGSGGTVTPGNILRRLNSFVGNQQLTQNLSGFEPTLTSTGITFDGNDYLINTTLGSSLTGNHTIVTIQTSTVPDDGNGYGIVAWGNAATGQRRSHIAFNGLAGNNRLYYSAFASNYDTTYTSATQRLFVSSATSAGVITTYVDGNVGGTTLTFNTYSNSNFYVGSTESLEKFIGEIRCVIVFNTNLNSGNVLLLSKFLNSYYSLGLVL